MMPFIQQEILIYVSMYFSYYLIVSQSTVCTLCTVCILFHNFKKLLLFWLDFFLYCCTALRFLFTALHGCENDVAVSDYCDQTSFSMLIKKNITEMEYKSDLIGNNLGGWDTSYAVCKCFISGSVAGIISTMHSPSQEQKLPECKAVFLWDDIFNSQYPKHHNSDFRKLDFAMLVLFISCGDRWTQTCISPNVSQVYNPLPPPCDALVCFSFLAKVLL